MNKQNEPKKMSLRFFQILKMLWNAKKLHSHEKWSRDKIKQHQEKEVQKLRDFAYANSPFYKKFHQGLENRPLHELPVLTKQELMRSWDEIVTDRSLHLKDVEHFLNNVKGLEAYQNKYFAFATGGTTGVKGITIYTKKEWLNIFSQSARLTKWTGIKFSLTKKLRMSTVQSKLPWHIAGAASFITFPFSKSLPLDVTEPMDQQINELNGFQPDVFAGFAGNIHLLAQEQINGRLKISPKTVLTTAETLKKEGREAIEQAWKTKPFEAYGSTEIGEAAAECEQHKGLHIFEDVIILEIVDNNNKPVQLGITGSKVLATVLWNYTLPFIRYELSDHIKLSPEPCPCGRPFQLIEEIQGREENVIYLPGRSGEKVRIEPEIFFDNMVLLPIGGWQVVQEAEDAVTFLILGPHQDFNEAEFLKRMEHEFVQRGAKVPALKIEYIKELRHTKLGKTITIQSFKKDKS